MERLFNILDTIIEGKKTPEEIAKKMLVEAYGPSDESPVSYEEYGSKNTTLLYFGKGSTYKTALFFSYDALIGVARGKERFTTDRNYSATTSKHRAKIEREHGLTRIPAQEFEAYVKTTFPQLDLSNMEVKTKSSMTFVRLGLLQIVFSYALPIAFFYQTKGYRLDSDFVSNTTSKHLNKVAQYIRNFEDDEEMMDKLHTTLKKMNLV